MNRPMQADSHLSRILICNSYRYYQRPRNTADDAVQLFITCSTDLSHRPLAIPTRRLAQDRTPAQQGDDILLRKKINSRTYIVSPT